jgi:hypothetical protein
MGDRDAIKQIRLDSQIQALPGLYCAIGDCAYTPSEHLVPILRADMAKISRNDNFYFFASQLRIRIEMVFGLMVKKWGILSQPLDVRVRNVKRLIVGIGRLNNFCIHERMLNAAKGGQGGNFINTPQDVDFGCYKTAIRKAAAEVENDGMVASFECSWSYNRDRMRKEVESLRLSRPSTNAIRS